MTSRNGGSVTVAPPLVQSKAAKASPAARKVRAYPPYIEMVKEAITTLKERTGSSQYAITKFIEEKQKPHLPTNFRKLLLVQLRKLVAVGKLIKVKNSFKLPAKSQANNGVAVPAKPKAKAPTKKTSVAKPKTAVVAKPKSKLTTKPTVVAKPKAVATKRKAASQAVGMPSKVPKMSTVKSPGKKINGQRALKKPKSIKSPAKKAVSKK